jgi:hypothetical protein
MRPDALLINIGVRGIHCAARWASSTFMGDGPDNPLAVKVAARNIPLYRDPEVMLIDQLKEI